MSQENVEIVRRCLEFWDHRDLWSRVPEALDPDVEFDLSRNIFNPHIYRGLSGFERLVSVVDDVWDDFRIVPEEVIDAGANVVAAVTIHGKGKESGVDVRMQLFQVWTFRDSKVVRMVGGYRDRSDALEAVGLSEQAMSKERVEILREGYLAFNRGDFEAAIAILDPDVELDLSRRTFDPAVYRGHEGVRKNLSLMAEQWATVRQEPQDFIVAGDNIVVVPVHFVGVGKHSGVETTANPAHVWTFRNGKIIRQTIFQTLSDALEAAGLSEQDAHAS